MEEETGLRKRTRSNLMKELLDSIVMDESLAQILRINKIKWSTNINGSFLYRPFDLRPINLNKVNYKIPKGGGVYFLVHLRRVVYIGSSRCFKTRVSSHLRSDKVFSEIRFLITPDSFDIHKLEQEYIRQMNPVYNKQGRTQDDYVNYSLLISTK